MALGYVVFFQAEGIVAGPLRSQMRYGGIIEHSVCYSWELKCHKKNSKLVVTSNFSNDFGGKQTYNVRSKCFGNLLFSFLYCQGNDCLFV